MTRRVFLSAAAAASALLASVERPTGGVVDLGCVLPESLAGFKTQAGDLRHLLIVPAVTNAQHPVVARHLERGATVLLEDIGGARVEPAAYFPYVDYSWPIQAKIREFAPFRLTPAPQDQIIATYLGQPVGLRRKAGDGTLITLGSPLGPLFLSGDSDAARWFAALRSLSA